MIASRDIRRTTSGDIRRIPSGDIRQTIIASPDIRHTISDDPQRTRSPVVAPRHLHPHTHLPPMPSPRIQKSPEALEYTPPRARTPDPSEVDADAVAGIPISRVSTAPTHTHSATRTHPARTPPTHSAARSVNKLSRMGFSTAEGYSYGHGWQPAPVPLGKMGSPPPKQRFGGIRTIMRDFQGK